MEGKPSPHLKKVLKSYQLTAANTLNGPSSVLSRLDNASSSSSQSPTSLTNSNNSSSNSNNISSNGPRDNEICNGGGSSGANNEKGGIGSVSIKYENHDFRESSCALKDRHKNHFSPTNNNQQQQIVLVQPQQGNRQSQHPNPVYVRSISLNNNACSPVSSGSGRLSSGSSTSGSNTCSPVGNFSINICNNVNSNVMGELARNTGRNGEIEISDNSVTISRQLNPKFNNPPSLPPPPILSTPDRSRTEKRETLLEGEYISCFVVGGEKRLCFPQILTTVLRPFSLPQINQVCDELQIFCSRCSAEQLEVLKISGVIPNSAHSCGLITKTDGERLVNSLLHRNPPKAAVAPAGRSLDRGAKNHFRVYHKCFGIGVGTVMPNLYERADSLCIECVECHGLFAPSRFVAHSHHRPENRTCHWGFDSANWRHYLHLSKDQEESPRWEKALEDFKARFDHKRKESNSSSEDSLAAEDQVVIKKIRYDPSEMISPLVLDPILILPKKRLPLLGCSENDQNSANDSEVDSVKKMLIARLGTDGAEKVTSLLDRLVGKISSLEQICRKQDRVIQKVTDAKSAVEMQAKVNTMEAELHSLKKQLLRRHEQREEI